MSTNISKVAFLNLKGGRWLRGRREFPGMSLTVVPGPLPSLAYALIFLPCLALTPRLTISKSCLHSKQRTWSQPRDRAKPPHQSLPSQAFPSANRRNVFVWWRSVGVG